MRISARWLRVAAVLAAVAGTLPGVPARAATGVPDARSDDGSHVVAESTVDGDARVLDLTVRSTGVGAYAMVRLILPRDWAAEPDRKWPAVVPARGGDAAAGLPRLERQHRRPPPRRRRRRPRRHAGFRPGGVLHRLVELRQGPRAQPVGDVHRRRAAAAGRPRLPRGRPARRRRAFAGRLRRDRARGAPAGRLPLRRVVQREPQPGRADRRAADGRDRRVGAPRPRSALGRPPPRIGALGGARPGRERRPPARHGAVPVGGQRPAGPARREAPGRRAARGDAAGVPVRRPDDGDGRPAARARRPGDRGPLRAGHPPVGVLAGSSCTRRGRGCWRWWRRETVLCGHRRVERDRPGVRGGAGPPRRARVGERPHGRRRERAGPRVRRRGERAADGPA